MSSHHIVREKQEPALVVLGMDSFSDELLGQLLEWSPTVIVTEPIAEKLDAYGIKIDWLITDGQDADIQSDVKFLPLKGSLIKTVFDFLIANNYSAVNMVTDELELDEFLPFLDKMNLVIFHNYQKIYVVHSGFSKWKPAGETIKLFNIGDDLRITGLEKTQDDVFKTTSDGIISIQFERPFLWVAEEL
jgi:thiamine pyrophosphokinase